MNWKKKVFRKYTCSGFVFCFAHTRVHAQKHVILLRAVTQKKTTFYVTEYKILLMRLVLFVVFVVVFIFVIILSLMSVISSTYCRVFIQTTEHQTIKVSSN